MENREFLDNKRNEYEKQFRALQNELKNEHEKIKKTEKDLEQYKSNEKLIINENNKLKIELQKAKKEYEELEKIINQINKEIQNGEIIDKYRKTLNENIKLKNEIQILNSNVHSEMKNLNLKLNEDLIKERNKIIKLEKENEKIKIQKNEQFENYKKNDYNEEYIGKKFEDFYDVVINIRSISSLSTPEGWPIKWNINRKEILKSIDGKKLFKIGVLGNGNMGKSFLLSRLFEEKIPSGYSIITEGLSIKHNYEKGFTILDSAGLQTPLLKEIEKEKDEKKDINKNIEIKYKFRNEKCEFEVT